MYVYESSVHGVCLFERWLSLKRLLMESRNILCYETIFQSLLLSLDACSSQNCLGGWEEQESLLMHQWQHQSAEESREMLAPLLGQSWDYSGWAVCIKGGTWPLQPTSAKLWWLRIQQTETLKTWYFTWKKGFLISSFSCTVDPSCPRGFILPSSRFFTEYSAF